MEKGEARGVGSVEGALLVGRALLVVCLYLLGLPGLEPAHQEDLKTCLFMHNQDTK